MGLGAEEVKAIMVDSEDTRGWYCSVAAALDEEEGGAKQREGAEEACSVESLLSGHLHQDDWTATELAEAARKGWSLLWSAPTSLPLLLTSCCVPPSCSFTLSCLSNIISNPGDTFRKVVTGLSK